MDTQEGKSNEEDNNTAGGNAKKLLDSSPDTGSGGENEEGEISDEDPETESEEKFDWIHYLAETKQTAAPADCFWQYPKPPPNRFQIGMKLEAVDPRNSTITSVATVMASCGPRIQIRLDGAGSTNDFWVQVDSSKIHPFGWTEKNGGHLQPPFSYENDPLRYTKIIKTARETKNFAPDNCFIPEPTRPTSNLFKIGMKLEATEKHNPVWICPATIVAVINEKIKIEYDGWGQTDLARFDSRDFFPCGWWKEAGVDIASPPHLTNKRGSRITRSKHSQSGRSSMTPPMLPERNESVVAKTQIPAPSAISMDKSPAVISSASTGQSAKPASPALTGQSTPAATPQRKYSARKSIVNPVVIPEPGIVSGNAENASPAVPKSAKRMSNGEAKKIQQQSTGMRTRSHDIPPPDLIITFTALNSNGNRLRFNVSCNGGQYLDTAKMAQMLSDKVDCPAELARSAFQLLIDCATDASACHVFNTIPCARSISASVLAVKAIKDGSRICRRIPYFGSCAAMDRALRDVLSKLGACPKLLATVETGCDTCTGNPPPAKVMKPNNDGESVHAAQDKSTDNGDVIDHEDNREPPPESRSAASISPFDKAEGSLGQDITKWKVEDVARFIETVIGNAQAELFRTHEVDGYALTLLTPEIMIKYMNLKVGPSVKISNAIERLKGTNRPNYTCPLAQSSRSSWDENE